MMLYKPNVIQEYAIHLYAKANTIGRNYMILFALGGGAAALAVAQVWLKFSWTGTLITVLVSALVFLFVGRSAGQSKAFYLGLQAQTVLCQVQIEENTRGTAPTHGVSTPRGHEG